MRQQVHPRYSLRWILLTVLLVTLLFSVAGYRYYLFENSQYKENKSRELSAITDLKVKQIISWRQERLSDITYIFNLSDIPVQIKQLQNKATHVLAHQRLLRWILPLYKDQQYVSICIFDANGRELLIFPDTAATHQDVLENEFNLARKKRNPVFSDLVHDSSGNIVLHVTTPVFHSDSICYGFVVLCIDPYEELYPLIQSWPVPSATSEALIVERDDKDVLYMNELRHRTGTALSMRIPLSEDRLPAAIAVRGIEGIVEGQDYRHVNVLAANRKIENSPWFLIAKIDMDEVYEPFVEDTWNVGIIVFLLIVAAGLTGRIVWSRIEIKHQQSLLKAELERQVILRHFDYLFKYANDMILLSDQKGTVVEMNDRVCQTYGYTYEELRQMNVHDLSPKKFHTEAEERFEKLAEQMNLFYESVHCRKDGTTFPVEISSRLFEIEGKQFNQSIIRDISERKKSEEALRASESFLNSTINQSPYPMWTSDYQGTLLRINQACLDLLSITEDEVLGKYNIFRDNIVQEQGFMPLVESVYRDGATVKFELNYDSSQLKNLQLKKNKFVVLDVTIFPIKDATGKISNAVIQHIDITERKRAEEELFALTLRQQAILAAVPDIIMEVDSNKIYTWSNKTGIEFFGNDVVGKEASYYFQGKQDTYNVVHPLFLGDENVVYVESWQRRKDGERRLLAWWCRVLKDKNGNVTGALSSARDITEYKQAVEIIAEQARLLEVALDTIIVRDMDNRLLFWNKAAEKLYGWTFEEARVIDVHRLIADEDRSKYEKSMQEFIQKGEWEGELQQSTKDGRKLITYSRWTLVRDKDGKPSARLIITRDITEQRALESQLRRTQRLENLGALAGGIAHDLNNVLAPILMATQILEKRAKDPQIKEIASALEKNVLRGRDIVKQVLLFARGGEEGFTPQQLRYIVDELKSIMRETFSRNITLRVNVAEDLYNVFGDATQLHQVLLNLCVNARDAMPNGGQLRIRASNLIVDKINADLHDGMKPGEYILLSITDNGIGIPKEIQSKVFDPFFTTKGIGKGTGLGLSTVFGIIKNHKGFIKLESEMGKGTEFKIYLPAVLGDEKIPAIEEEKAIQPSQGETILLVDDELTILQISREALETYGYNVIVERNGSDAVAAITRTEKGLIRLAIIDFNMPGMDGISTIEALRNLDPNIKIILSSGDIAEIDAQKLAQLNIQGALVKPFTAKKMLETVWSVLHS